MYITADYLDVGPLCHDLEEDIMTSPQTERVQTKKEVHAPSLKCAAAHMDKPNAFWAKIYGQMKQRLRYLVTMTRHILGRVKVRLSEDRISGQELLWQHHIQFMQQSMKWLE